MTAGPLVRYRCDEGHEEVRWASTTREPCWFCGKPGTYQGKFIEVPWLPGGERHVSTF